MTEEERYLFDLQGFLVVRGVLPATMLRQINDRIDELESLDDTQLVGTGAERRYRQSSNVYAEIGTATEERLPDYDCKAIFCGEVFEELIDWPVTLSYIEWMVDQPFRLDAASLMSRNPGGGLCLMPGEISPQVSRSSSLIYRGDHVCYQESSSLT